MVPFSSAIDAVARARHVGALAELDAFARRHDVAVGLGRRAAGVEGEGLAVQVLPGLVFGGDDREEDQRRHLEDGAERHLGLLDHRIGRADAEIRSGRRRSPGSPAPPRRTRSARSSTPRSLARSSATMKASVSSETTSPSATRIVLLRLGDDAPSASPAAIRPAARPAANLHVNRHLCPPFGWRFDCVASVRRTAAFEAIA